MEEAVGSGGDGEAAGEVVAGKIFEGDAGVNENEALEVRESENPKDAKLLAQVGRHGPEDAKEARGRPVVLLAGQAEERTEEQARISREARLIRRLGPENAGWDWLS